MAMTRLELLQGAGLATLSVVLFRDVRVGAATANGGIGAADIAKYRTAMVIPPAMPRAAKLKTRAGKNIDYYEIAVRQFRQQILPTGMPDTTVWGYGSLKAPGTVAQGGSFNYPSFTIEAKHRTPVRVKWVNDLVDASGNYLPHLLPVDQTLHWANPPGGAMHRDTRPEFTETPGPYTGPVPIVTHVHGAIGVGDESDGYAEAWYLPAAGNIPAGYATEGTWRQFFAAKALTGFGAAWGPGFSVFQYPNDDPGRAATLWYHDHTLGMTRANVYAGPAGFYVLRGGPSDQVLDARSGMPAVLPGPAPALGDPAGTVYYEIPLAIQDRSFNEDGSLFYPDSRAFFDGVAGPYIPVSDVSPIWNPEFFGNTMLVNGNTWPFLDVEQRRYRFRLLNGCNSRFLILDFSNVTGAEVWQIGNEGGYLAAPLNMTALNGGRFLLAPAERADVIVDFTNVAPGGYVVTNLGPDEPFGGGEPDEDFDAADPDTTGQVLELRVRSSRGRDPSTPPMHLQLPAAPVLSGGATVPLALIEMMSEDFEDAPAEALLGRLDEHRMPEERTWSDPVSENPNPGDTQVWELYNFTADAHPIHVHDVAFQVVDRQALETNEEGETEPPARLVGDPRPPEPWESGVKETVIAYPGEVTRIRAKFDKPGQFVWHCHIVEHEDNEMMRPYRVGPKQDGQPEPH